MRKENYGVIFGILFAVIAVSILLLDLFVKPDARTLYVSGVNDYAEVTHAK